MENVTINGKNYIIDIEKCISNGYLKPKINYVDLGLPSGTLWASENVDDNYYTFDEAVNKFGNQLPTRTQFCELVDYTTHKFDKDNKVLVFTGKNGNSISFPAAGFRYGSSGSLYYVGNNGYYWSCTPSGSYAYSLYFNYDGSVYPSYDYYRASGQSVRLVKDNFLKI